MTPAAASNLGNNFDSAPSGHSPDIRPPLVRALAALAIVYVCFLAMEALHELGHMLNAWSIGANIIEVRLPLIGWSETIVEPDPDPRFVPEGGPTWGVAIPAFACMLAYGIRRRVPGPLKFFAGFCL